MPEIRDEIYCELCKQLSKNPKRSSILKGLELMGLCVLSMPPTPQLIAHLMGFLQKTVTEEREAKSLVNWLLYSFNKLINVDINKDGGKKTVNVRVQLSYGPSIQVSFDPDTRVRDIFKTVVHKINLKNTGNYYLYWLQGDKEKKLLDAEKLSEIIQKGEGVVPDLRLRRITTSTKPTESVVKLDMLFFQASHNVVRGKHPVTSDEAILLSGYHIQALYGDYDPSSPVATPQTVKTFMSPYFLNTEALPDKINKAHSKVFSTTSTEAKVKYLEQLSKWSLHTASLFAVEQPRKSPKHIVMAITEDSILLLAPPAMDIIARYTFTEILNWSVFTDAFRLNTGSAMKPVVHSFNTTNGEAISDMLNHWRSLPTQNQASNLRRDPSKDSIIKGVARDLRKEHRHKEKEKLGRRSTHGDSRRHEHERHEHDRHHTPKEEKKSKQSSSFIKVMKEEKEKITGRDRSATVESATSSRSK